MSTLLGCSPPPFAAALKRGEGVFDMSRSSLSSAFDDSGSSGSSSGRESGPERGIRNEKKTNEGDTLDTTKTSSPTSTPTSPLAARRARVLGANVATVDSSLPPIVFGKGSRLFAHAAETDEPETSVTDDTVAGAGGAEGAKGAQPPPETAPRPLPRRPEQRRAPRPFRPSRRRGRLTRLLDAKHQLPLPAP